MTSFLQTAGLVLQGLRLLVFAAGVATLLLAGLTTLVRTRRLSAFGGPARFARRVADPVFRPMERAVLRAGGQPSHAPWWTVAAVVAGGLALLSVVETVLTQAVGAAFAASQGPRGLAALVVTWAFQLLRLALMVRVLGSWFGQGRYSRWTGWSYRLTDWFMEPLSRVIPPLGVIDITPLIAYFGLGLLQGVVVRALV